MSQSITSSKFKLEYTTDSWSVRVLGQEVYMGNPRTVVDKKYCYITWSA